MTGLYVKFGNARRRWLEQRWWRRIAIVFCLAWLLFVALCIAVALAVGAYGEVAPFFTAKGALVVLFFVLVFGAEGAILGGMVDLLKFLAARGGQEGPTGKPQGPGGT